MHPFLILDIFYSSNVNNITFKMMCVYITTD